MFAVDDIAVVQRALFDDLTASDIAGHPHGPALVDVFDRFQRKMSPRIYARYVRTWREWFAAAHEENKLRRGLSVPDLHGYLWIRRISVGIRPNVVALEHILGIDLGDLIEADPDLEELGHLAIEHIMLVNDLFSFRAEFFRGDYFSAVAVLMRTHRQQLPTAINTVVDRIAAADHALSDRAALLRQRYPDPHVLAYIHGILAMPAGNLRWTRETARYNGIGTTWNGLRSGLLTLRPDRTTLSPL